MRILVAPDSFKGTFSAVEVTEAIARGIESAGGEADRCPVADGGEGTMAAVVAVMDGEEVTAAVHDPLGREITARWAKLGDGLAIVEMAQASGLMLVDEGERDAWAASTAGTGELIAAAVADGAREVLVAVGGSATTDGGRGAIEAIEAAGGLGAARLTVLCDVTTTWERCPAVFGPQKGASPELVSRLEERLDEYAQTLPRDPRGVPMTGAAGGLSGGLWAALGAELVRGAERVLDLIGFDARLSSSLAVVAGEGGLDFQSLEGKIVGEIASRAVERRVPLHAVVGTSKLADGDAERLALASVTEASTLEEIEAAGAAIVPRTVHRAEMLAALAVEAEAHRLLLDGAVERGRERMSRAADRWWASWESAPPGSIGRLVGMLKAAAIAERDDLPDLARRARGELEAVAGTPGSPAAGYVHAISGVVLAAASGRSGAAADPDPASHADADASDVSAGAAADADVWDVTAGTAAMRTGGPAFCRAADALDAIAARDADAHRAAIRAIVTDFEGRDDHLTGVPIADTALMMERLGSLYGLASGIESRVLPQT